MTASNATNQNTINALTMNRKLTISIIQTYILIFIQVLFASTYLFEFLSESYDEKKAILYQVTYAYVYVSILFMLRNLLINYNIFVKYLFWIIRLELIKVISGVLVFFNVYQAGLLASIAGFILFVLYIMLIVTILNKKHNDKTEVVELRLFAVALTISFIIALISGIYAEFHGVSWIYGILHIISAIPFVFLIRYFDHMKVKMRELL